MDLLVNEEANANVVISNTDSWVEQEKEVCVCVCASEVLQCNS